MPTVESNINETLNSVKHHSSGNGRLWGAEEAFSSTWPPRGQPRSRRGGGGSLLQMKNKFSTFENKSFLTSAK